MIGILNKRTSEYELIVRAVDRSRARIEFDVKGKIISANDKFLDIFGYRLDEIVGRNHGILVDESYRNSQEYTDFWDGLRRGDFRTGQFKRIAKDGREVWIEAAYNPIIDGDGKVVKVIKYASDISVEKQRFLDLEGKVAAILRSQAVIEFALDGTIMTANDNFLRAMGYSLAEIVGKNHSLFVEPAFRNSPEYGEFWNALRRGEYQAAQFKRIGKGGREVWIEASYNPILDPDGKVVKVVKYATDITRQVGLLTDLKQLIDVNFAEIDVAISRSSAESGTAASAADETSGNVQQVTSRADAMTSSITQISTSMDRSRAATDSAFDQVVTAGQSTQRLSEAAAAMGGIVGLIQNIAGQINLLALNATIESARAGDAGKGFAVVANEVKNLANQAARATGQISQEIEGVQAISNTVVSALEEIRQSIGTVRDYVAATASAVKEQDVMTREMSHSLQRATSSVETIATAVQAIATTIAGIDAAVDKTKQAANVLAH